jgi:hypothetical protein
VVAEKILSKTAKKPVSSLSMHDDSGREHVLLGLDKHSSQRTLEFLYDSDANGVLPFYTPADCTDCVAPCDHHCGKWIKGEVGKKYVEEVERSRQRWAGSTVSEREKRFLMLKWLGEAWNRLMLDRKFILSAFTSTGFLMELEQPNKNIKLGRKNKAVLDYDMFARD